MNRHFKHQEGTILITVMISMLLIMGIGSALISHFSVTEAKEIEQSLAEVRIRWAMMSELNYMLIEHEIRGLVPPMITMRPKSPICKVLLTTCPI